MRLKNMITAIGNKRPFIITIMILIVIGLIMLLPVDTLLLKIIHDDFKSEYGSLFLKMGLLFLLGYSLIKTFKFKPLAGLSRLYPWSYKYLNLIPVYLFILGILSVSSRDFSQVSLVNLILLLVACLMVGFAEEYLFRGFLQTLFLKKYGSRKRGIFMSVLFASVSFGLFHLLNLVKNDNSGQVFIQVIYATFIGFFFGALLLKTNKIIPIAITHGLINFFFSLALLPSIKTLEDSANETASLAPIILFLPLLIVGLLIVKRLDKKSIIEKLEIENTHS